VRHGFPSVLVCDEDAGRGHEAFFHDDLPVLRIERALVARWDADRRARVAWATREEHYADRLRALVSRERPQVWVDLAFRDLSKAAGARLPSAFRGFARRVMEFPARYGDLGGVCAVTGLSRGALKARFRRRGLPSPYTYLRWCRAMAAAHVLEDPGVTTFRAAERLGFTSDGNFCRTLRSTTGLTPTELRSATGRERLIADFVSRYLEPEALEVWDDLDTLFLTEAA
ncbi:MAG TPA: helix-turn-helix domain-containing protein, partial [Candidatus Thermoplasmatota archaeon]